MRRLKAPAVFSLAFVVGCSACSAGDKDTEAMAIRNASGPQLMVAGIELADDTALSTDIRFYVLNTRDAAVNMLIWNTPLEPELSADIFTVTLDGAPMAYQGRMVKRSTATEKDYFEIPAHEGMEAVVDMAMYYEMSQPGEYQVRLTPSIIDGQIRFNEQTPVQQDSKLKRLFWN